MTVTLAQFRAFERIARLGSFSAAASAIGITQPSISQRIRDLEQELGAPLFTRRGPRIALTADGHAFLEHAARTLESADDAVARFRQRDPLLGKLRLGVNESFALICLTDLMRSLGEQHPSLQTSVVVGDTGTVSRLLNEHQLDLAVVSEPEVGSHIRRVPLGRNELGWIAKGDFPLPDRPMTPDDIARHHLMVSPQTARLHATMSNWFAEAGVTPRRVSTCNALSVTILSVLSGLAIGLVPVRVVADDLAAGRVLRIPVTVPIGGHAVSLCYQIADFGPSLQAVVELSKNLIEQHNLFQ